MATKITGINIANNSITVEDIDLSSLDTDNVSEGNNLYFTTARANTAIDNRVTQSFVNALNVDADTLDSKQLSTIESEYQSYTDNAIAALANSAPAALDTLNELAAALNDDANFATTVTNSLATKLDANTDITLTLDGDVSGSATFVDMANATLTVTVSDNSHNHVANNITDFESSVNTAIDARVTQSFVNALNVDADLLDGANGTFYLDYTNFTNAPSIPQSGVDFDPVGTDNSTDVTLAGSYDYLTITGQQITLNQIDYSTDISNKPTLYTTANANTDIDARVTKTFVDNLNVDADTLDGNDSTYFTNASNIGSGTLASARLPDLTVGDFAAAAIQTGAEGFTDSDSVLMTAAAVQDKILSYGYSTTTGTVTSVGGTGTVNGLTLSGTVTSSGNLTLGGSLSGITVSQLAGAAVQTSAEGFSDSDTVLMTAAAIQDKILSFGYSTATGTVTSVGTGGGLTGGTITGSGTISHADTSTQASVNNSGATVIQDVTLDTYGHVTGLSSATLSASTVGALASTNPVITSGTITEDVYTISGTSVSLEPDNGSVQLHTLTGNTTYSDGFSAGQAITLMIDDGSSRTVTWPTMTWVNNGGSAPTLATSGYTVVALWKAGSTLYGALVGDGS